ncbi:MAG TPA: nuclear transport factor 2 family protein [Polyangia bacterium]|nr:nuclear transport factor 2 family protein [Polyangia bacterium]
MPTVAFSLALCAVVIAAIARPAQAASDEKAVQDALEAWRQAMLKKDRPAFEKLYHPDLVYAHSGGKTENKPEAIASVVDGPASWEQVNLSDTKVRLSGKIAIVTGKVEYHQRENGTVQVVPLVVMTVWSKGPKGWQMLGRQASKLPAPAPVAATTK